MDRDVLARAERRRRALDALAFERDREAQLVERLEDTVAEIEGARVDEETYARLQPEDVALVRAALHEDDADEDEPDELSLSDGLSLAPFEDEDEDDSPEDEIARLEQELAGSRRTRRALERYLEALGG